MFFRQSKFVSSKSFNHIFANFFEMVAKKTDSSNHKLKMTKQNRLQLQFSDTVNFGVSKWFFNAKDDILTAFRRFGRKTLKHVRNVWCVDLGAYSKNIQVH